MKSITNLIQIPVAGAPSGITAPIALLDADWRDFGSKLNIEFESGRDDLDDLYAACVETAGGNYYGLVYHLNAPVKGIEVRIKEPLESPRQRWAEFLGIIRDLQLGFLWIHPDVE